MSVTPSAILLLAAVICFVLATFSVAIGTIALVPLGLAFFAAALLVNGGTRNG